MLTLLDELADARIDLSPGRYGLLNACDGGLLEVSGLNAPVGALCQVAHHLLAVLLRLPRVAVDRQRLRHQAPKMSPNHWRGRLVGARNRRLGGEFRGWCRASA